MSSFEDDITARMHSQDEAALEAQAVDRDSQDKEERLRIQALKLGSEVVDLLHNRNIPSSPVWIKKKLGEVPYSKRRGWRGDTHSGVDHIFEYVNTDRGWEIVCTYSTDEGYSLNDRIAIDTTGQLLQYRSTETSPDGRLTLGSKESGIVSPKLVKAERAIKVLESDLFKNACAHLIRIGEPMRVEINLFLDFDTQPLDDSWQTKI